MKHGPQLENGYSMVANEILEDLASAGLTGIQYQLVIVVLRKTYGECQRDEQGNIKRRGDGKPLKLKEAPISIPEFMELTGCSHGAVVRNLKLLVEWNVLRKIPGKGTAPARYGYQKYKETWRIPGRRRKKPSWLQPSIGMDDNQENVQSITTDGNAESQPQQGIQHREQLSSTTTDGKTENQTYQGIQEQSTATDGNIETDQVVHSNGRLAVHSRGRIKIKNKYNIGPLEKETGKGETKKMTPPSWEELARRYSPKDQEVLDEYWQMIRRTRKSGKLAESVVLKWMDKWSVFPADVVIAGLRIHLAKYPSKREEYTYGIIRRLAEERNRKNNERGKNDSVGGVNHACNENHRYHGQATDDEIARVDLDRFSWKERT